MPVRLKPAEYFLSFSGSAMGNFDRIVKAFVHPVVCAFGQGLDWLDVAAKLIMLLIASPVVHFSSTISAVVMCC